MMDTKFVLSMVVGLGVCTPALTHAACVDDYPMKTITSIGGGQSSSVNKTLTATFNGHIMTTDGLTNRGRNVVKICPGTTVDYAFSSTITGGLRSAVPDCADLYHSGSLGAGNKISCNNKNLGGSDTDTFAIKDGM